MAPGLVPLALGRERGAKSPGFDSQQIRGLSFQKGSGDGGFQWPESACRDSWIIMQVDD